MHDAAGNGDRDPRGESWQRGYADRKALLCGQAAAGGCGDGAVSRAREYGVDRPDYYAKMAKAFLMDRDGGGAEKKIAAYYRCVAGGR